MIEKDIKVKHKSSQLKGFGSKTCASSGRYEAIFKHFDWC
jgi:ribosomal protein S14